MLASPHRHVRFAAVATSLAVGNRKQMVDLSGTHSYDYDAVYRLKQVAYPGGPTDTYTYDGNGNRKTKNSITYQYDAANQMTWDGSYAYTYDPNGNQAARGSEVFTYDHENRLSKVVPAGGPDRVDCPDVNGDGFADITDVVALTGIFGQVEAFYNLNGDPGNFVDISDIVILTGRFGEACSSRFTYNGDGLRVGRSGSRLNWQYIWDTAAGLPVILNETDSHNAADGHGTDNTYVYGLDLISATTGTTQTYFLYDGLGSTANLTDGAGTTTGTYSYDVFGGIRSQSGTAANGNEWRFTGEQRDPQGGRNFYYLRARYYDPATGRFLSQDPLPTGNLYVYAGNDPVNFVDPSGMCVLGAPCPKPIEKAGEALAKRGKALGKAAIRQFGPPYNRAKIVQIVDILPWDLACGGGAAAGAVGGFAVGGPIGGAVGGGTVYGTCKLGVIALGLAAFLETESQIVNSGCGLDRILAASGINFINFFYDFLPANPINSNPWLSTGFEASLYVTGSELIRCGQTSNIAHASDQGEKE